MFRENFRDDTETKPYNPVRILEWVLCSICLTLAMYILLHIRPIHIVLKTVFLLVPVIYFFITLADIVVTSLLKPMLWTSWIIFATMGAQAFFLCSGFLILRLYPFDLTLYSAILIANTAAGTVFLFDLLCIISLLVNTKISVVCIKDRQISTASQSTSTTSTLHRIVKREEKANQLYGSDLQFMGNNKTIQCPSDSLVRRQKFTCIKDTCPKKCTSPEVPSHGGTFHVSKDVAPILSPSLLRNIPTSRSCRSTPTSSPRYSCKPNSINTDNSQNKYPNIREEAVTRKSRTVSTSARMVPKQSQERNHSATGENDIPEDNDTRQQGTNQFDTILSRPSSASAVSRRISANSSPVQHRYPCAYCGKHQFTATEALTACGDLNNTYKYQILPTLHEDSSSEEPTKDLTYCPHPSPTSSSSNKPSPCSLASVNTCRSYTPKISSVQTSPQLVTSLVSRSTLEKTDKQLLSSGYPINENQTSSGKVESHPLTFCNKRKVYITNADDPNARKRRTLDQRAGAIFNCETQCKNKEIQTQPYKIERKNDFTCTYNDHKNLSTNQQDHCGPNSSNKQNNYDILNGEPDNCFSKAQRSELLVINSNAEEDTVLPGAADRSPRNEPRAERNVRHSKQPTVIDICDESSNEPVIHLLPTKCHQCREPTTGSKENRTNVRRSSEKCTVM